MTSTQTQTYTRTRGPEPIIFEVTALDTALADVYASIFSTEDCTDPSNLSQWPDIKMITITNTDSNNSLKYTIYASNQTSPDNRDWVTLIGEDGRRGEQTVDADSSDYQTTALPWVHLKVECRNNVEGATASTRIKLRTLLKRA